MDEENGEERQGKGRKRKLNKGKRNMKDECLGKKGKKRGMERKKREVKKKEEMKGKKEMKEEKPFGK